MTASRSVLPKHMRIAALQCNFEGGEANTLSIPAKWSSIGFNVEQLFHTHSELYSALYDETKHKDLLQKYLVEERRNGVSVILYMNCHIMLPSQNAMKDQWGSRKRDGSFIKYYEDVYFVPCLNSPWADFFLDQLGTLKGFDLAGFFFDGPILLDCFCPCCQERYRKLHGGDLLKASNAEAGEFSRRSFIGFIKRVYEKVKSLDPSWVSYTNLGVLHGQWSSSEMSELLKLEDLIGTEGGFQFYGPPKDVPLFKCSLAAKAVESVSNGKPTVIFMAGDHKPWSWHLHTPAETKLAYASALFNGASVWYGIHSSTELLDSGAGDAMREMVAFDKRNDGFFSNSRSLAETALLHSFNTARNYSSKKAESDLYASGSSSPKCLGDYQEGFNGAAAMLTHLGIPFDFISELSAAEFKRYKNIVVPNAACLDDATVAALTSFVKDGGTLIADGETSLYDGEFKRRPDFALGPLFGVKLSGAPLVFNRWDYFCLEPAFSNLLSTRGVKYIPAPLAALEVSCEADVKVVARLCPPLAGRYAGKPGEPKLPLVSERAFGAGRAVFIAGTFFELYKSYGLVHFRELVNGLLKAGSWKPEIEIANISPAVEVSFREDSRSGFAAVLLVNYDGGMTRPIAKVVPAAGLELSTRESFKTARSLVSGKKLKRTKSGSFALPAFAEFEAIVLER